MDSSQKYWSVLPRIIGIFLTHKGKNGDTLQAGIAKWQESLVYGLLARLRLNGSLEIRGVNEPSRPSAPSYHVEPLPLPLPQP